MATTWEQLCNQALRKAKIPKRIGSAYEGSEVAKACLELFGQTRDFLIGSGDWEFARRANIILTLLKGPPPMGGYGPWAPWTPAFPPPPWRYEYAYPADCISFAAIVPSPMLYPILNPQAALWRIDDDAFDAHANPVASYKAIMANQPNALGVYWGRVTNPSLWDAGFTEAFVDALADNLVADPRVRQADERRTAVVTAAAQVRQG
jgi:hypothetical protein